MDDGYFVSKVARYFSRSKLGSSGLVITMEMGEISKLRANVIIGY
jgi:hypothetical protein